MEGIGTNDIVAMTVKELLLEVRRDLKTLVNEYEEFRSEMRDGHDENRNDIKSLIRRVDALEEDVNQTKSYVDARIANASLFRTVFGPAVVPAILTVITLATLIIALSQGRA